MKVNQPNQLHAMLILVVLFTGQTLSAQSLFSFGVKGGLNASKIFSDELPAFIGYHAGFFSQAPIHRKIAIQPELLFSSKGFVFSAGPNQKSTHQLNYLDLPMTLVFKLAYEVEIQVGGYVSYLLATSSKVPTTANSNNLLLNKSDFNKLDFGLVSGLSFRVRIVQLGIRYNFGLQNLAHSTFASENLHRSKIVNAQLYLSFNLN